MIDRLLACLRSPASSAREHRSPGAEATVFSGYGTDLVVTGDGDPRAVLGAALHRRHDELAAGFDALEDPNRTGLLRGPAAVRVLVGRTYLGAMRAALDAGDLSLARGSAADAQRHLFGA